MPKSAVIFHGTGGNPDVAWYSWLGNRLTARGYSVQIPHYPGLNQERYDWEAIRSHVREAIFVNSVVDPYGCDATQGRAMFDRLGGTLIVRNDGHFGDYDQPYPTFELLDRLID